MAKFIFQNSVDTNNTLQHIFTDTEWTAWKPGHNESQYKVIEVTGDDLNNCINETKQAISFNSSDVITYQDLNYTGTSNCGFIIDSADAWTKYKDDYCAIVQLAMDNWTSWPNRSSILSYLTSVKGLAAPSSFPLTQSFGQYINSQSLTYINPLQLP